MPSIKNGRFERKLYGHKKGMVAGYFKRGLKSNWLKKARMIGNEKFIKSCINEQGATKDFQLAGELITYVVCRMKERLKEIPVDPK